MARSGGGFRFDPVSPVLLEIDAKAYSLVGGSGSEGLELIRTKYDCAVALTNLAKTVTWLSGSEGWLEVEDSGRSLMAYIPSRAATIILVR